MVITPAMAPGSPTPIPMPRAMRSELSSLELPVAVGCAAAVVLDNTSYPMLALALVLVAILENVVLAGVVLRLALSGPDAVVTDRVKKVG